MKVGTVSNDRNEMKLKTKHNSMIIKIQMEIQTNMPTEMKTQGFVLNFRRRFYMCVDWVKYIVRARETLIL